MLEKGNYVKQDLQEAFRYYSEVCDKNTLAALRTAYFYAKGIVVEQDMDKAIENLKNINNY